MTAFTASPSLGTLLAEPGEPTCDRHPFGLDHGATCLRPPDHEPGCIFAVETDAAHTREALHDSTTGRNPA